ncbi:MAG: hypothetical protein WCF93_03785 [Candidatus Moraniibacteriota bacterium]
MNKFMKKFDFRKELGMFIGIERESFLTNLEGKIVPIASDVLKILVDRQRFGYELSACQLEDRIGPCKINEVKEKLIMNKVEIQDAERRLGFRRNHYEIAPVDIPLDIYPDPTGRYQKIAENISADILLAACRVIGTHVHVGMPNADTALRVYNQVCDDCERLCVMGDGSNGERLKMYELMAPDYVPKKYKNWKDFYENASQKGFVLDPRRCWDLIRISVHGTIEFRMFGATNDLEKIVDWAQECHRLCSLAIK